MKSVIVKFREYLPRANNTEKSFINYLLKNPEKVAEMTIRDLAKEVFVSSSTITRICHKTGFDNYKSFQKNLIYENALRKETIRDYNSEISKTDTLPQLVDKIIYKSMVSLEDTKNLVDMDTLDASVNLLSKARKIVFFGMGASLLVAKDAYIKFLRVNKNCQVCEDYHMQLVEAENMTSSDVAVIISYSGMTEEMLKCAEIMKNNLVTIISITGYSDSKLTKIADYDLYVSATEFEFKTGKLGSRLSQLAIIDMLYVAYVQRNYETCMNSLKKTYISKLNQVKKEE